MSLAFAVGRVVGALTKHLVELAANALPLANVSTAGTPNEPRTNRRRARSGSDALRISDFTRVSLAASQATARIEPPVESCGAHLKWTGRISLRIQGLVAWVHRFAGGTSAHRPQTPVSTPPTPVSWGTQEVLCRARRTCGESHTATAPLLPLQAPHNTTTPGTRIIPQMIFDRFCCTQGTFPNR